MPPKKINTFKFKTFRDIIADIDIRSEALYRVPVDRNANTDFYETVQKWAEQNQSDEYNGYSSKFVYITNLAQLVCEKEQICKHLQECLQSASELALQPLLEITVALATELRVAFHEYFYQFWNIIVKFLESDNSDRVRWTLYCLAELVRCQRTYLLKNFDKFLQHASPLLEDSEPYFVTHFAAECLAFIARSLQNPHYVLDTFVKLAKSKPYCTAGCGTVLFETMHGVKRKLHSTASSMLNIMNVSFTARHDDGYATSLYEVLVQTFTELLEGIDEDGLFLFWSTLNDGITMYTDTLKENSRCLKPYNFLKLVGLAVEKSAQIPGRESSLLVHRIVTILKLNVVQTRELRETILKILLVVLKLAPHISHISHNDRMEISKAVVSIGVKELELFEMFVRETAELADFEVIILPQYMELIQQHHENDCLQSLAKIILLKMPLCVNGKELFEWKKFPITLQSPTVEQHVFDALTIESVNDEVNLGSNGNYICALLLLPHIVSPKRALKMKKHLLKATDECVEILLHRTNPAKDRNIMFLLSVLLETIVHLKICIAQTFIGIIDKLIKLVEVDEIVINSISLCIAVIATEDKQLLSQALFQHMYPAIRPHFSSFSSTTRLLCTHMFAHFSVPGYSQVYNTMYGIEATNPTVNTYRDQVLLLQNLTYDGALLRNITVESVHVDVLKYVCSLFSINFNLLWAPTCDTLATFADHMKTNVFWAAFNEQLECVERHILNKCNATDSAFDDTVEAEDHRNGLEVLLAKQMERFQFEDRKIDYPNIRNQMLLALSKFTKVCKQHGNQIVKHFWSFTEKEYKQEGGAYSTHTLKALVNYLKVLVTLHLGKVNLAEQLYEFLLKLIRHRDDDVVNLALDCIFTYENPKLIPYREIINKFSNGKTIKVGVQLFLGNDDGIKCDTRIAEEHRETVLSLIMYLLHGKMINGKIPFKSNLLVMRFLVSLSEDEVKIFLSFSFGTYQRIMKSNPLETLLWLREHSSELEESNTSQHKIHRLINFLEILQKDSTSLRNEHFRRYLIHLKMCFDAILFKMDHNVFKKHKSQALLNVVKLFQQFCDSKWTSEELEAVFQLYVWPMLPKFVSECIHTATPLLKLFFCWSQHPCFYHLLCKPSSESATDSTPLHHVLVLLQSTHVSATIRSEICHMFATMLQHAEEDDDGQEVAVKYPIKEWLKPYTQGLYDYVVSVVKQKKALNEDNLAIMARLTDWCIVGNTSSDGFIGILLPIISKTMMSQRKDTRDEIRGMLHILLQSVKVSLAPEKCIRTLARLLERTTDQGCRKMILEVFVNMASNKRSEELSMIALMLTDLNALDMRWLDQPDYQKRLETFRMIDKWLVDGRMTINMAIVFIAQCLFLVKTEKDLAMKQNAIHYLKQTLPITLQQFDGDPRDVRYLLEVIVLPSLSDGIRGNDHETRNDCIQVLGEFCRKCAQYSPTLKELTFVTDEHNFDIDFFENMTHLQIYRHHRGMNRFCETLAKQDKPPSARTLFNFMLPIVSQYICNEKFRKKNKLVESAGNCIVAMCKVLPWKNYKTILWRYLGNLKTAPEYQKQIVKILIGVLNSFPFVFTENDDLTMNYVPRDQMEKMEVFENEDAETMPTVESDQQKDDDNDEKERQRSAIVQDLRLSIIPKLLDIFHRRPDSISRSMVDRAAVAKVEMTKLPIAIAIVKLLRKVPKNVLQLHLSRLLMTVISFMKTRLNQVRALARVTLTQMTVELGAEYLEQVLEQVVSMMKNSGFQPQLLSYTIYSIIEKSQDLHNPKIMTTILPIVLMECTDDLFGKRADDNEHRDALRPVAKEKISRKVYQTLNLLARNVPHTHMLQLIEPFCDVLATTTSKKNLTMIQEAFHKISDGICLNQHIPHDSLLIFINGILNTSHLIQLNEERPRTRDRRPNAYEGLLIPTAPSRRSAINKRIPNVNAQKHVIYELALEILHKYLKRNQDKLQEYESYLNPLLLTVIDSIESQHPQTVMLAVNCISTVWATQVDLPILHERSGDIIRGIFKSLHDYANVRGDTLSSKSDSLLLVRVCFKAIVALLKFVKYTIVSQEQLLLLVHYIEQHIKSSETQMMAFILLRAVIARRMNAKEVHQLMQQLVELSISCDNSKTSAECRNIILDYMMNYPLGKRVHELIYFFVEQLQYETISGRISAISLLKEFFERFPEDIIRENSVTLFFSIGIRLVNDEDPKCRMLVAECLVLLLKRLDVNTRHGIFSHVLELMGKQKPADSELACQLMIRLVRQEKEGFYSRLPVALPALLKIVSKQSSTKAECFVKPSTSVGPPDAADYATDHLQIQAVNAINEIFETCPNALTDPVHDLVIDSIAYAARSLLSSSHSWIRQGALQIISSVLKSLDFERIHTKLLRSKEDEMEDEGAASNEEQVSSKEFIYSQPLAETKKLTLDLCAQLVAGETEQATVSIVLANLLMIANILRVVPFDVDKTVASKSGPNLIWLIRRVRYAVQNEINGAPTSFTLRKSVLRWMSSLLTIVDKPMVEKIAPSLLMVALRETSLDNHKNPAVQRSALVLCTNIRKQIPDTYDQLQLNLQSALQKKRTDRKTALAQEKIRNPQAAAKRKINKQARKVVARKRRIELSHVSTKTQNRQHKKLKRNKLESLFDASSV